MDNVWVYPYRAGSNSARDLARALGVRRISHTNSRFRGRPSKTIINWGATQLPEEPAKCRIINHPDNVRRASNKLVFFQNAECRKPEFFTEIGEAYAFLEENGGTIVERHELAGHSGEGIRLVEDPDDLSPCRLYTEYVPKKQEYRVHVFNGRVLDVQRKARRRDIEDDQVNWKIRNNANGFVFARNGDALGDVPGDVMDQALRAVGSLGLDFGAADVIYNERHSLAYVLEVNTAPGLVGTTLDNYQAAFEELLA